MRYTRLVRQLKRTMSSSTPTVTKVSSSPTSSSSSRIIYPKWTGPSQVPNPVSPPSYPIPIYPPPIASSSSRAALKTPPKLPRRAETPSPPPGYTSSKHVLPGAWPRQFREVTGTLDRSSKPFFRPSRSEASSTAAEETKEQRIARNLAEAKECVKQRFDATEWTAEEIAEGKPGMLWIAAERWKRDRAEDDGKGLVLILAHANGFTKESWMPTIWHLLKHGNLDPTSTFGIPKQNNGSIQRGGTKSESVPKIDEIWFLDDIHHGESIDLNAGLLGSVHCWSDGGRDIVNFIENVLPNAKAAGSRSDSDETLRWVDGSQQRADKVKRRVIGMGHSVGGNAMVRAAHLRPDLFEALFLVEPMTAPICHKRKQLDSPDWHKRFFRPVLSTRRRTQWPSREAAAGVRSSPFFASWHSSTFDLWLSHGLVDVVADVVDVGSGQQSPSMQDTPQSHTPATINENQTDHPVELATPSWSESAVFGETTGLGEGWDTLPHLEIRVGFAMAHKADTLSEDITREIAWRCNLARNERIKGSGHLIVQETPEELGEAMWRFLGGIVGGQEYEGWGMEVADAASSGEGKQCKEGRAKL